MSNRFLCLMILILPLLSLSQISNKEINWTSGLSWEDVKQKAKEENKFIFIDAYATWCVPCKKMDKEVYTNDSVAAFFKDRFISVKLQMDSTAKDNNEIKRAYAFARKISSDYKVTGFPTLLFFSPEGILTGKELGFRNSQELVENAQAATSSERLVYYKQLEKYKAGEKDYTTMKDLAVFVANVVGDKTLSKQIASDYINNVARKDLLNTQTIYFIRDIAKNYKLSVILAKEYKDDLFKTSPSLIYKKENLDFFNNYVDIITLQDRLFEVLKTDSAKIDSIVNRKGWRRDFLRDIVYINELYNRFVINGKPIGEKDPEWEKIKSEIKDKYNFLNIDKLVLDFQIDYYRGVKLNWKKWVEYKQQRINRYPPNPQDGLAKTLELNDGGAWDAFLNCNDKDVLQKTLPWIDMAIKLSTSTVPKEHPFSFMDTKANVLYKIGRISEAIRLETQLIKELKLLVKKAENPRDDATIEEFSQTLENMKARKPTYVHQGAKWAKNTNPQKGSIR